MFRTAFDWFTDTLLYGVNACFLMLVAGLFIALFVQAMCLPSAVPMMATVLTTLGAIFVVGLIVRGVKALYERWL